MNKIKVALIAAEFLPNWGGAGTYNIRLVKHLMDEVEFHVITPRRTIPGSNITYSAEKIQSFFDHKIGLHFIANASDKEVKVWDFREGRGKIRVYLWLEEWDYVVVLAKRKISFGNAIFLVTAYYVDGDYQRRVLQRKYSNREA